MPRYALPAPTYHTGGVQSSERPGEVVESGGKQANKLKLVTVSQHSRGTKLSLSHFSTVEPPRQLCALIRGIIDW